MIKRINLKEYIPTIASGILYGLSYPLATSIRFEFFAWFAFVPLLLSLRKQESFFAFYSRVLISFMIGSLILGWWLGIISFWGMIATGIIQPLTYSVIFILLFWSRKKIGWRLALITLPMIWTVWEYIFIHFEHIFGIFIFGMTQSNLICIIQYIDLFGIWSVSFWLISLNIYIVINYEKHILDPAGKIKHNFFNKEIARSLIKLLLIFFLPPLIYFGIISNSSFIKQSDKIKIALIQTGVDPNQDQAKRKDETLYSALSLTDSIIQINSDEKEFPDLIVWPESTIGYYLFQDSAIYKVIFAAVEHWRLPLLTGVYDREIKIDKQSNDPISGIHYNSAAVITPELVHAFNNSKIDLKKIKLHHKRHLIPFFEYVIYSDIFPFLNDLFMYGSGGETTGKGLNATIFKFADRAGKTHKTGALLCSEELYPAFTSELVTEGAEFINILANDGWFKKSPGVIHEAVFSRLRAIESRRSVVRASVTGISLFITPLGEIYTEQPWWQPAATIQDIQLSNYKTFYTSHFKLFPIVCVCIYTIIIFYSFLYRKKKINIKKSGINKKSAFL